LNSPVKQTSLPSVKLIETGLGGAPILLTGTGNKPFEHYSEISADRAQIMLFSRLGDIAARKAAFIVVAWLLVLAVSLAVAPRWVDVVQNGEFAFLPEDTASRIAETDFLNAFPHDILASSLVVVVRREHGTDGLTDEDRSFVSSVLIPELHRLAGLPFGADSDSDTSSDSEPERRLVQDIKWFEDRRIGDLLISEDGQATLVVMDLTTEFLDQANAPLVASVEDFLERLTRIPADGNPSSLPGGLEAVVSGSATFGRDMIRESNESARSTETWTVALVIVLLLLIYRAPLVAMIPLITVALATTVSLSLLAVASRLGWISLFNGIETYVTVVVYGAGVDYCLFLIARYREELDGGATIEESVTHTLTRVGAALTASAGTVMCGIGMMVFAEFGKFRQAGVAITFGLAVCLAASLTLTPAILRLFGRWAFWPHVPSQSSRADAGFLARTNWFTALQRANLLQAGWHRIGKLLLLRPWTMWLGSVLVLLPFSVAGLSLFGYLSYGLMSELPDDSASVYGARAVQSHFAAGEIGPVSALIEAPDIDFSQLSFGPEKIIARLTDNLVEHREELGLYTVRSLAAPKGQHAPGELTAREKSVQRKLARNGFVSKQDPSVTRVDLIFQNDPFSRSSIQEFRQLRDRMPEFLPPELQHAKISYIGATPNVSDLKDVTDRDQIRIDTLVLLGVYVILVILLRRPGVCGYLILSVFYSYLATLGITFLIFWSLDPGGFAGLDWKVPLFLFTILIAVGEDYNIFLMSRIEEEQRTHGPVKGIVVALERTGSIISSCGIIMAGTFSSLLAGSLVGMNQLGLALALGVLLDTFIVRPIMVPAFLILLKRGSLGFFSRVAGVVPDADADPDPVAPA
jgi:putative drug exporter of the RND superfamily